MQGFRPHFVNGIEESFHLPFPRTHWAWTLSFLPKVCMLCHWHGMNKKDAVILAENSCWPTDRCTPVRVREVLCDSVAHGAVGSWIGYCGCVDKKRVFEKTFNSVGCMVNVKRGCKAPRGSKLFVITLEGLDTLCKAFECAPVGWYVDAINQCMVASGHLSVKRPALAGSMKHYSELCGREVLEDELAETL